MKKIFAPFLCLLIIFSCFITSGCSEEFIDIGVFCSPSKIIYEVGEDFKSDGLVIKAIKTDSAVVKINNSAITFSGFNSTSAGKKTIIAEYGDFSTSFDVFVANKVLTTESNIQNDINSSNNNDILKLSKGVYPVENCKNIAINKSLTIIGESKDETVFHGNFLVGESVDTEKVMFQNITFKLNNKIENSTINCEGDYVANKNLCAINTFSSKAITINNCNFKNYSFGVLSTDADGLIVSNSIFDSLYLGGIKTLNSTKNAIISKNCFINISTNMLVGTENDTQEYLATMAFAFNKTEVAGVIVYDNAITKVALKTGDWIKFNTNANALLNSTQMLSAYSYVNNTAAVLLYSTNGEDLPVYGVAVAKNSFGNSLNNILYGLGTKQNINASAVLFND